MSSDGDIYNGRSANKPQRESGESDASYDARQNEYEEGKDEQDWEK
jgi:hypothetical protein